MKNTETFKVETFVEETVIRVKFKKINGGFYRPTRIRKIEHKVKEYTDEKYENIHTSYPKITYKPYLPIGSPKLLNHNDFITEWEKGPTPQPKKQNMNTPNGERGKGGRNIPAKNSKGKVIKDLQESIAAKKAKRKEQRAEKRRRLLGSANSKNGTITVFFTHLKNPDDKEEKITTKTFPSKGLQKNQEYKKWCTDKNIIDVNFHRTRGDKDKEIATSELARKTQKESPKYEKLKAKRRKKFEERITEGVRLAKKARAHAKSKGKTIKMKDKPKPHKELDWKEIKELNKKKPEEEAVVDAETNLAPKGKKVTKPKKAKKKKEVKKLEIKPKNMKVAA